MTIFARGALALVAMLWSAPAGAATFLVEGQIDADDYVISLGIPGPSPGTRTTFEFSWSGGVPDGGEVNWIGRSVRVERFNGLLIGRDRDDVMGCGFAYEQFQFPGNCYAYPNSSYAGPTAVSFTTTPNSIRGTFQMAADYDICDLGLEGQCSVVTHVQGGQFTAFFLGATTYRVTVTSTVVPEPAVWTLMIGGFGLAGAMLRRRRQSVAAA